MGTVLQLGADSRDLRPELSSWCTPSRGDITALYLHQLKGGTIHVLGGHVNRDFIPPLDKVVPCFSRQQESCHRYPVVAQRALAVLQALPGLGVFTAVKFLVGFICAHIFLT